ncbi:odorant receptor 46a-like isoform X1 [Microplitis mediator]|uniref:odorant receptor 46a-like isoform X1 n=1 Tax=Microplitis mediator TaxID=375433 RepID=UPI002552BF02|nr:odorant receptor 46a-like isoform X1 [Microplitis mediator]
MYSILPGSFIVLQAIGLWKPTEYNNSPILNYYYRLRTFITFFLIYSFTITGIAGLILTTKDIGDVTSDCFILLSIFAICGKIANIIWSRNKIIWIIDTLNSEPCKPLNNDEMIIQQKVDRLIWHSTLFYGILTEITVFMVTFGTLLLQLPIGTLPYNTYLPWDYSHGYLYWVAYGYQIISVCLSANSDIGFDTLVPGLMLQITAKLEILKYRFINLVDTLKLTQWNGVNDKSYNNFKIENKLIADYVKCHLIILKLADTINKTFDKVILLQFFISSIVLCISVYNLAFLDVFTTEFTSIILYLCCMLMEIFILCAAGNQVTIVSSTLSDAIYHTDWINLDTSSVKSLMIIMNRGLKPIIFSSGHIIKISYDSFKTLIKLSYSSYNVLQRT